MALSSAVSIRSPAGPRNLMTTFLPAAESLHHTGLLAHRSAGLIRTHLASRHCARLPNDRRGKSSLPARCVARAGTVGCRNTHLSLEAMNFLALRMRDMAADGSGAEGAEAARRCVRAARCPVAVTTRPHANEPPDRSLNRAPGGRKSKPRSGIRATEGRRTSTRQHCAREMPPCTRLCGQKSARQCPLVSEDTVPASSGCGADVGRAVALRSASHAANARQGKRRKRSQRPGNTRKAAPM
jgi:hypothetical protein